MSYNSERVAFTCAICGEAVYVGEDYYDLPELGKCHEDCVKDCKRYEAEDESFNAYIDAKYDEMKERQALGE